MAHHYKSALHYVSMSLKQYNVPVHGTPLMVHLNLRKYNAGIQELLSDTMAVLVLLKTGQLQKALFC
jgi:hypothetical protein